MRYDMYIYIYIYMYVIRRLKVKNYTKRLNTLSGRNIILSFIPGGMYHPLCLKG